MEDTVIQLNNKGVDNIKRREFPTAIREFREALSMIRLVMGSLDFSTNSTNKDEDLNDLRRSRSQEQAFIDQVPLTCSSSTLYLHDRGIKLLGRSAYSSDLLVDATVRSGIVLYNLGLAHHLSALSRNDSSGKALLLKAQAVYSKVWSVFDAVGMAESCVSGEPFIDFLLMATMNNLGLASFQNGDFETSQATFGQLVCFCASLETATFATRMETAQILNNHKSWFILNALTLQCARFNAASAA